MEAYEIIQKRIYAKDNNKWEDEQDLSRRLKRQVKHDKLVWLRGLASSGTWDAIKKLRQPKRPDQGRLKNASGTLVDSDERAEVLANYLQEVQWVGEGVTLTTGQPPLWGELPVDCGPIIAS